jgi:predicted RNase H-like HicB family nuclease
MRVACSCSHRALALRNLREAIELYLRDEDARVPNLTTEDLLRLL